MCPGCATLVLVTALLALPGRALAQGLPAEVDAALAMAKLPRDAVAVLVVDAQGKEPPRVSHRVDVAMNPASVMKLVTTSAALDLLGPAYAWTTSVFVDGPVREGRLEGNLYIRGQGDPTLVSERFWQLMRRVRSLGINRITGDIVLDRSAFSLAPTDPGGFDGEPLRPYNAAPDALLLSYKSVLLTFVVDRTAPQGKFLLVYSKIVKSGGSDEPIVCYLSPAGNGYRIVDISVLGVRLSSAMRQRFNDELKKSKGNFEPLYAMLREAETW